MKKIIVISGFSGVGKGTVAKKLVESNSDMNLVTSMTTREPRHTEKKNEYHFVTKEEFKEAKQKGKLLESNTYEENLYGTPVDAVEVLLEQGKIPVLEIDPTGYNAVCQHSSLKGCEIIGIFLTVSADELFKRLKERKTNSYESIIYRMIIAKGETKSIPYYSFVFENLDTELTVKRIEDVVYGITQSDDYFNSDLFSNDVDRIIREIDKLIL